MNCSRFCFFNADGDRGGMCESLFAELPSAVLGELSLLRPRQEELLGVCPSMAFCALPWRRESFCFLDNWGEEEDDDDDES